MTSDLLELAKQIMAMSQEEREWFKKFINEEIRESEEEFCTCEDPFVSGDGLSNTCWCDKCEKEYVQNSLERT